jgi:hypothetical protein
MTTVTADLGAVTARFDTAFATISDFCANFRAGADDGRKIEARYAELACKSTPDLAKLGLKRSDIARAALDGARR